MFILRGLIRLYRKAWIFCATICLIIFGLYQLFTGGSHREIKDKNILFTQDKDKALVTKVIDGDTFVCQINGHGEEITIRMLGIDCPESVHKDKSKNTTWGKKASDYTKDDLEEATVWLEYDKEKTDQYGRTLAYVYSLGREMINKKLVKKGLARAVYYEPNGKYKNQFEKLMEKAKKKKKGFWKDGYKKAFPS
ncbi:MAG: thermonuclease family protein [Eubacterium sp.]|nr:thermonuclease family protein [Eubacterium sp.]